MYLNIFKIVNMLEKLRIKIKCELLIMLSNGKLKLNAFSRRIQKIRTKFVI